MIFSGVFHLNDKKIYKDGKKISKLFTSFDGKKFKVPLPKKKQNKVCNCEEYAIIECNNYNEDEKYNIGTCLNIIGKVGDIEIEREILQIRNNIKWTNIKKKTLNDGILEKDLFERVSFINDESIFPISIDPEGSEDLDDCLHFREITDKELYEVGVHIADVSSYILEGSDLDKILMERVETKYYNWKIYHMIPKEYSTEIFSLRKGKESRVISIIFNFDKEFNLINSEIKRSLIINKKELTYEKAEGLLSKDTRVSKILKKLYNIGEKIMNDKKLSDLSTVFTHNKDYDMHKMVEIFMILANVTVANKLISYNKENTMLRRHIGLKEELLKKSEFNNEELYVRMNIEKVSCAEYCRGNENNTYHYGLGEDYYTHFTSPIRRYSDICVHRLLSNILGTTWIYKLPSNICNKINNVKKNIKRGEYESKMLDIFYEYYDNNEGILETTGYIINIYEDSISIFVPKLSTNITYNFIKKKMENTVEIKKLDNELSVKKNDFEESFKLFQELNIKVIFSKKEWNFKKKFQVIIY